MAVIVPVATPFECEVSVRWKSKDPNVTNTRTMPTSIAASPILVTTKAFFAALAAAGRSNQWPIRRYEQSPTPSHPTYSSRKFSARTSVSMKNTNRLSWAK